MFSWYKEEEEEKEVVTVQVQRVWTGAEGVVEGERSEEEHQTEEHDAQERNEAHGGGDDESLDVKGKRHGGTCAVGIALVGLVGDEREGLVGLVGPVWGVAAHVQVGQHGVVATRVAGNA